MPVSLKITRFIQISQARITLARAVYSDARILLLDDILSSLDAHTSQWIVDKCLVGDLVRGRTVILVTHNIGLTQPIANRMILISGDGQILTQDMRPDCSGPSSPASYDAELLRSSKEDDTSETAQAGERDAKSKTLIGKEEMAVGRVSGSAGMAHVLRPYSKLNIYSETIRQKPGPPGFPSHMWHLSSPHWLHDYRTKLVHSVLDISVRRPYDCFGPREKVRLYSIHSMG